MRQITTFVVFFQVIWDIPNQVFTVYTSCSQLYTACALKTRIGMSPNYLRRVLQMVLCLILSAYPCINQQFLKQMRRLCVLHWEEIITKNLPLCMVVDPTSLFLFLRETEVEIFVYFGAAPKIKKRGGEHP